MPTAARLNQVIGFLAKEEADSGTAETLSNSTDACTPYIGDGDPDAPSSYDYVYDGATGRGAGTLAPQRRATPSGRFRAGQFRCLPKGLGSAYSASAFPPNEVHRWLKACGLDATYSASPTPQWSYTPTAFGTTFTTLTVRQFAQGSQFDQTGVHCNFSFETQGLGVPVFTFDWRGIASSLPSDVALPTLTHQATSIVPPIGPGMVANIGAFSTAVVRRVAFRLNRSIESARIQQTIAGGHAGFVPGGMSPELEIEIERPARATYDPESVLSAATSAAVDVTIGTTQYNRYRIALPQAQLTAVAPGAEGALATVTLTFRGFATTPAANDFFSLVMN